MLKKYKVNLLASSLIEKLNAEYPIVQLNIKDIGVDLNRLQQICSTYESLPWDMYLVKRDQVAFLAEKLPWLKQFFLETFLPDYFADYASLSDVKRIINRLDKEDIAAFEEIQPYRRRGISSFLLEKSGEGFEWNIEELPYVPYTQTSNVLLDYRNLPRSFPPSPVEVTNNDEFRKVLAYLATFTDIAQKRETKKIKIICQQVGIVSKPDNNREVSNAPEGIHQDSCDYIVSALVVERKGVIGGESVVYAEDKKTELLRTLLLEGDAIFQADKGSPLWHDVEPIESDGSRVQGIRNIIGYDIYIEE
jgi:hypothetical protein